MDFEIVISEYLSAWGMAFVAHQFDVPYERDTGDGGSSPDFVVIDFEQMDVAVVEVSSASNIGGLLDKVRSRTSRWYRPIVKRLVAQSVIKDHWPPIRTIVFIRSDCVPAAEAAILDQDVTFVALEDATFPYKWYEDRTKGLPNRASSNQFGRGNPRGQVTSTL